MERSFEERLQSLYEEFFKEVVGLVKESDPFKVRVVKAISFFYLDFTGRGGCDDLYGSVKVELMNQFAVKFIIEIDGPNGYRRNFMAEGFDKIRPSQIVELIRRTVLWKDEE